MKKVLAFLRGLGWKRLLFAALNVALVFACCASLLGLHNIRGTLESLTAARRFRGAGELRFAQLACYLPADEGKSVEDIYQFRQTLDSKLVEQSLEAPENGRLYLDAYYGMASVKASTDNGAVTAQAVGVGGSFFYFHPLRLRGGSYISEDDLMDDLVVLDEETAWRLFGGVDLAGMTLTIEGSPFVVAGVVAREDDFASQRAYNSDGGIFLSYSALARLREGLAVTGYELVMPDPISGYAVGVLTDSFNAGNGDIVENSSRYSLSHLWSVLGSFGERSMRLNGVIYPYWENAVRLTEDYAALLLLLALLTALCPAATALVLAILYIRRGYRAVKAKVPEKVDAAVERRREKRLADKVKKEE